MTTGALSLQLTAVRRWGGVLEHPCDSKAWAAHGLVKPKRHAGWTRADDGGGWTCYVEQGHYGHAGRKATWIYACCVDLPELNWSKGEQRLHPETLAKHGYEKARRMGMNSVISTGNRKRMRSATPVAFRDVLIAMAKAATAAKAA